MKLDPIYGEKTTRSFFLIGKVTVNMCSVVLYVWTNIETKKGIGY